MNQKVLLKQLVPIFSSELGGVRMLYDTIEYGPKRASLSGARDNPKSTDDDRRRWTSVDDSIFNLVTVSRPASDPRFSLYTAVNGRLEYTHTHTHTCTAHKT